LTNDTVEVRVTRKAAGFFSVLFGIDSATVHARASARAGVPAEVRYVAPIVVNQQHPQLSGPGCPCFNTETTLPLGKDGAPGGVGLTTVDPNATTGAIGTPTLADWLQNGYSDYLPLGTYYSDPGAKFNSSQITDALELRIGTEMLFPVFDSLTSGGANAKY